MLLLVAIAAYAVSWILPFAAPFLGTFDGSPDAFFRVTRRVDVVAQASRLVAISAMAIVLYLLVVALVPRGPTWRLAWGPALLVLASGVSFVFSVLGIFSEGGFQLSTALVAGEQAFAFDLPGLAVHLMTLVPTVTSTLLYRSVYRSAYLAWGGPPKGRLTS